TTTTTTAAALPFVPSTNNNNNSNSNTTDGQSAIPSAATIPLIVDDGAHAPSLPGNVDECGHVPSASKDTTTRETGVTMVSDDINTTSNIGNVGNACTACTACTNASDARMTEIAVQVIPSFVPTSMPMPGLRTRRFSTIAPGVMIAQVIAGEGTTTGAAGAMTTTAMATMMNAPGMMSGMEQDAERMESLTSSTLPSLPHLSQLGSFSQVMNEASSDENEMMENENKLEKEFNAIERRLDKLRNERCIIMKLKLQSQFAKCKANIFTPVNRDKNEEEQQLKLKQIEREIADLKDMQKNLIQRGKYKKSKPIKDSIDIKDKEKEKDKEQERGRERERVLIGQQQSSMDEYSPQ
ncbi:DNA ligase 1, partial [Reticulomyxa filosa]